MVTYSNCGRPNACRQCIEIDHDEENDVYIIFDNDAGWESEEVTFEQLMQLKELLIQLEDEREDIVDLD
jgi:hypothetical protein